MLKEKQNLKKPRREFEFLRMLKRSKNPLDAVPLSREMKKSMPVFNDYIVLENGYHMSIQCGRHSYSNPRRNLENLKDYIAFEVACFDMNNDWIVIKLRNWGVDWGGIYEGGAPTELFKIKEGHVTVQRGGIMPYLPKEDVELLYQYLKRQKRKFVITEKYKKHKFEDEEQYY